MITCAAIRQRAFMCAVVTCARLTCAVITCAAIRQRSYNCAVVFLTKSKFSTAKQNSAVGCHAYMTAHMCLRCPNLEDVQQRMDHYAVKVQGTYNSAVYTALYYFYNKKVIYSTAISTCAVVLTTAILITLLYVICSTATNNVAVKFFRYIRFWAVL